MILTLVLVYLFSEIDLLLDEMAPIRKISRNEIRLQQRPWITHGILTSMKIRDKLLKQSSKSKDPVKKITYYNLFKKYRNLIVTLQRRSKGNYYQNYFESYRSDVKKTWDGIRNILNVSKKKNTHIDQLNNKNSISYSNIDKANTLNDFFVNIGASVEAKMLIASF